MIKWNILKVFELLNGFCWKVLIWIWIWQLTSDIFLPASSLLRNYFLTLRALQLHGNELQQHHTTQNNIQQYSFVHDMPIKSISRTQTLFSASIAAYTTQKMQQQSDHGWKVPRRHRGNSKKKSEMPMRLAKCKGRVLWWFEDG